MEVIVKESIATYDSTSYTKTLVEALEVPVTEWGAYYQAWISGIKAPIFKLTGYKK